MLAVYTTLLYSKLHYYSTGLLLYIELHEYSERIYSTMSHYSQAILHYIALYCTEPKLYLGGITIRQ
jgi:hypothetical protein